MANLTSSHVTAFDGWASEFRGWTSPAAHAADAGLTTLSIGVLLAMLALRSLWGPGLADCELEVVLSARRLVVRGAARREAKAAGRGRTGSVLQKRCRGVGET